MDWGTCRQTVRQLRICFHSLNPYQSVISMRKWPTGAVAICEVLRAIQCICQPASHSPALLSSAYTQSILLLQYHSTSDGLDILSLFLFLLVFLMQASKESILMWVVNINYCVLFLFKREHDICWNLHWWPILFIQIHLLLSYNSKCRYCYAVIIESYSFIHSYDYVTLLQHVADRMQTAIGKLLSKWCEKLLKRVFWLLIATASQ